MLRKTQEAGAVISYWRDRKHESSESGDFPMMPSIMQARKGMSSYSIQLSQMIYLMKIRLQNYSLLNRM